ncbi:glycerophosphodiester phosphodiesterase domain-containing protein 5 isoform X2 [Polyodon spathula]|uniref:glycerophosphodiester phosphodiesterase domain-containing protein 5 isoform X2 n=1 Tax=Polyodon spathula TaxID=7913 RepID=UPI001B7F0C72|nr:glycerophosphodiester phosphodiesterase domain-containing protein 5 isoform X2 [Polyodon spathula]
MNLHWLHKFAVTVTLVVTVISVISMEQLWGEEWDILLLSFQATGPFLHLGALAAITLLAWLVAGQFARAEKNSFQAVLLLTYLTVLTALYLVPLSITSPCLMEKSNLGPKPAIIGHQGAPMVRSVPELCRQAPMLAPENTLMSFQKAIEQAASGLYTDVTISHDGVPFLMHDNTLRRTTDVEKLFPERVGQDSSMFNWTDLQALNAGQWFLKDDPFWTVSSLSEADWALAGNQSVCTLSEVLQLAENSSKSILFNVRRPPPEHPHRESWINVTLHTVLQSGVQQQHVMWTPDTDRQLVRQKAPGFQQTSTVKKSVKILQEEGIVRLNLRYNQASAQEIRDSREGNVSLTLFTVSEPWLYSVLWCSGVQSVTSDAPHILRKLLYPIWIMPPDEYKLLWITADVISFIVIIGVFVLQNYHMIR